MRKSKAIRTFGSAFLTAAMLLSSAPSFSLPIAAVESDAAKESNGGQLDTTSYAHPVQTISALDAEERSVNFNQSWSFHFGDSAGAEQPLVDDSSWEIVNVPHDYSINQDYDRTLEGESAYKPGGLAWYRKSFTLDDSIKNKQIRIDFDGIYMNSTVYINGHKLGDHPYGYTPFSFDLTPYLNKDGENVISVRVNHQTPSSRWYSGSGIGRNVHLTVTEDVHVDLSGTQITTPNLEAQKDGDVDTNVKTTIVNNGDEAKEVTVQQFLYEKGNEDGEPVASSAKSAPQTLEAGASAVIDQTFQVNRPKLWHTTDNFDEKSELYTVVTKVYEGDEEVDSYDTEFGFRYFKFDKDTGFWLNGEAMKLNGVCMHHDQGALGSVDTYRAVERQVEILKGMGVNSIRTSHNTPSKALVDVCNENGIILMEEVFDGWDQHKNGNTEDYANYFSEPMPEETELLHADQAEVWAQYDLQESIRRDRNDPAVVIWDIGNEVEHGSTSHFPTICQNLLDWTKAMDDRPAVLGDNKTLGNATGVSNQMRDSIHAAGGLIGSNYGLADALQTRFRDYHPDWRFIGTETVSSVNSRGIYDRIANQNDAGKNDKQLTSYDYSAVSWGHRAAQSMIGSLENDWYAGQYVWTGFDYLGEPTPWNGISNTDHANYGWPAPKNSYFGIIDTAGIPKDTYYFYRSMWKHDDTTLHMLPAWKSDVVYTGNAKGVPVVVYTNAHKVKLEFTNANGVTREIGTKEFTEKTTANGYKWRIYEGADKEGARYMNLYFTWYVPYEDGTLTATAYDVNGDVIEKTVGRNTVSTFGDAAALDAVADRTEIKADGNDLSYITVDIKDADGNEVANANNRVTFSVEGPGEVIGCDNGNSVDFQPYEENNRAAFSGKMIAIVRSTGEDGEIRVTASADGLTSDTVVINASGAETPQANDLISAEYSKGCYLRSGAVPTLPATAKLTYADGTVKEDVPIVWEDFSIDNLTFDKPAVVNGVADGQKLSYYINLVADQGAVANYSAVIKANVKPELPSTRPFLNETGDVLPFQAPVTWKDVPENGWAEEGTYVINGTADVLGREYPVTASIRVGGETVTQGENVVPSLGYKIEQNIPAALQSDTLLAIKDGNVVPSAQGGTNKTIWTNFSATNATGENKLLDAEIKIYLDTAQLINQTSIYFIKDTWSAVYPNAGAVKLYASATGEDGTWTEIDATETIGDEKGDEAPFYKEYKYTFDPMSITVLKVAFTTPEGQGLGGANVHVCHGISEIEMYPVTTALETGTSTDLETLIINGKDEDLTATQANLLKSVAHLVDTLEVKGADNAAVTVVSQDDSHMLLYVESEDHSTTRLVTVKLQTPYQREPESEEYDLDRTKMTASASSVYPGSNEGPAANVLDNSTSTWYHTNWNTQEGSNVAHRHIDLTFDEPQEVAALRYLPRNSSGDGGRNGQVVSYKVQYKATDDGNWIDISEGEWPYTTGWKVAEFDRPVTAKAVRFIGVETMTNGNKANSDMSAAEVRVARKFPKEDVTEAEDFNVTWPDSIGDEFVLGQTDLHNEIKVSSADPLHYGTDYYFEYEANPETNEVTVTLKGNGYFDGEVSKTYKVKAIISIDTTLLELAISEADDLLASAADYKTVAPVTAALPEARTALQKKESQQAVNEAALALNQALLEVRLKPSADALDALK